MKKRGPEPLLSVAKTSDALYSIKATNDGDFQQLIERLQQGLATKKEMSLAADLIRNEIKPRRPRSSWVQRLAIAEYVAFLRKVLPAVRRETRKPTLRKQIIGLAAEKYGVKSSFDYEALREFNDDVLGQINRMPPTENERGLARKPDKRLRKETLEKCSREILYEIIEGFLDRA